MQARRRAPFSSTRAFLSALLISLLGIHKPLAAGDCPGSRLFGDASAQSFGVATVSGSDFVAVGAPGDSELGAFSGAVYIFMEQSGQLERHAKLNAPDAEPNSYFGAALAASPELLIVGSTWDDQIALFGGSAYVFRRSGSNWDYEGKLVAPDGAAQNYFGGVVAVNGNVAAVASLGNSAGADGAGAVYVYLFDGSQWAFSTKLVDPQPEVGGRFGHTLAVFQNQVLVGSNITDRVRIFTLDGAWSLQTTLTALNPPPGPTGYGSGMTLFAPYLAVSSLHLNSHEGVVYLYKWQNEEWTFLEQENSPDGFDLGHFGWHIAMNQDRLVVGGEFSRHVYLYQRVGDDWRFERMVTSQDPSADDGFGSMVGVGGGFAVAGASSDETSQTGLGSAYVFPLNQCIPSIPALGSWGISVLGLSILGMGSWIARRGSARKHIHKRHLGPTPV